MLIIQLTLYYCFSVHTKEIVKEHKAQNQAGKSSGECKEGSQNIHGADTWCKQLLFWCFIWANHNFMLCIICFCLQQSNLESLPPHVPTYLRAAVGPPGSSSRRHFCTVCGFTANYTCVRCGMRFCSCRCQNIHNDTRCLKFVAWSVGCAVE